MMRERRENRNIIELLEFHLSVLAQLLGEEDIRQDFCQAAVICASATGGWKKKSGKANNIC